MAKQRAQPLLVRSSHHCGRTLDWFEYREDGGRVYLTVQKRVEPPPTFSEMVGVVQVIG